MKVAGSGVTTFKFEGRNLIVRTEGEKWYTRNEIEGGAWNVTFQKGTVTKAWIQHDNKALEDDLWKRIGKELPRLGHPLHSELWWRCLIIHEYDVDPYDALGVNWYNGLHGMESEVCVSKSEKGLTQFVVNGWDLINALTAGTLRYWCVPDGYEVYHNDGRRTNNIKISSKEYIEGDKAVKGNSQWGLLSMNELITAGFLVAVHTKYGMYWNCKCGHCARVRETYLFPKDQASSGISSEVHSGEEPQKEVSKMAMFRVTVLYTPPKEIVSQGEGMPSTERQPDQQVVATEHFPSTQSAEEAKIFVAAKIGQKLLDLRKEGGKLSFVAEQLG